MLGKSRGVATLYKDILREQFVCKGSSKQCRKAPSREEAHLYTEIKREAPLYKEIRRGPTLNREGRRETDVRKT